MEGIKRVVYFAVDYTGQMLYLDEHFMQSYDGEKEPDKASDFRDVFNDMYDLGYELSWKEVEKPTNTGMYQAVVQFVQTGEDDYDLRVKSCTPLVLLS